MIKSKKKTELQNNPRHILLRITRVHFFYVLAYMLSIIIFDSGNMIEHESVLQRWTAAGSLLVVNTIIWYLCRAKIQNDLLYRVLFIILIACDILFASANVYWQRGMASKAVLLYLIPIISAGLMKSRSLVLATAGISAIAYSMSAVKFFYENYGQGYRIELYGEIVFYSLIFFVFAFLMMINFKKAAD